MTDRAVSVTVNYVLSLAITALLISGLLIATGDVMGDQRDSTIRGELGVVGERISEGLAKTDRLARTGPNEVRLVVTAPRRVAGKSYTIEVDGPGQTVSLETSDPAVSVEIPFRNETNVASSTAGGGDVEIVLTAGELEVRSA